MPSSNMQLYAVAISKTAESKKALLFTLDKIIPKNSIDNVHLALIHVQKISGSQNISVYANAFSLEIFNESDRKKIQKTQQKLKEFTDLCTQYNVKFTLHHEIIGNNDIGNAFLRVAREIGANTIVVGTRQNSFMMRAFLGSVSSQILHGSTVPVVVVP